jgi:hypothetical protein
VIELFFVACLATSSPTCEERSLLFVDVPIQTCMLQAQGKLAGWSGANPGWTIQRWSCRDAGTTAKDA